MHQGQTATFLPKRGNFRDLQVYRVCEVIYDLTYYFVHNYLKRGDRTIDQMLQAARSGKQNIAEGSMAAVTSAEMEIKLTNVARASLGELLLDYEDYLRNRGKAIWGKVHPRYRGVRAFARSRRLFDDYASLMIKMTDEELGNLCLTLLHQADYLLERLLEHQQKRFLEEGGVRELMSRSRRAYRSNRCYPASRKTSETSEKR